MRSFVCSALFIAVLLIGQQWVARSSEAESHLSVVSTQTNGVAGYAVPVDGRR